MIVPSVYNSDLLEKDATSPWSPVLAFAFLRGAANSPPRSAGHLQGSRRGRCHLLLTLQ